MTETQAGGGPSAPTADELAEALRAYMVWVDIAVQYLPFGTLATIADVYTEQWGARMTPDAHTILARYDAAHMEGHDNA